MNSATQTITKLPWAHVMAPAKEIVSVLKEFCIQVKIAGDLRRYRPLADRIVIVAQPVLVLNQTNLFAQEYKWDNGFAKTVARWRIGEEFNQAEFQINNLHAELPSFPVTLIVAQPHNFGFIMAWYTGPIELQKKMAAAMHRKGIVRRNWELIDIRTGNRIDFPDEQKFFEAIGFTYREPKNRY